MKTPLCQGRHFEEQCRPNPIVIFNPVWAEGQRWYPDPGDRHALTLLKRKTEKKVSFHRAYRGWRASGAREEAELGEGRAFLRWLQKFDLSIDWKEKDIRVNPFFADKDSPKHDPQDEMAQGLSFAIKPVSVQKRRIKLYIPDQDMISILNTPYGNEEDFLDLVMKYVSQRFEWNEWKAPAPTFLDWLSSQGKRPLFKSGQLGFDPFALFPEACLKSA